MSKQPSIMSYDDLNGEECMEILHTRFYNLLQTIPELQRRFAITRAKLRLEIVLDIYHATPPKKIYHDAVEIVSVQPPPQQFEQAVSHHEAVADVDARENAPDLIREQHGLPLPRSVRMNLGVTETGYVPAEDEPMYPPAPPPLPTDQLPANLANPNTKRIGRRTYAGWIEQDYGSLMAGDRQGGEGPVIGGEKVGVKGGGDHAPLQPDFAVADYRGIAPEKAQEIIAKTVEGGRRVDQTLENNERIARKHGDKPQ